MWTLIFQETDIGQNEESVSLEICSEETGGVCLFLSVCFFQNFAKPPKKSVSSFDTTCLRKCIWGESVEVCRVLQCDVPRK